MRRVYATRSESRVVYTCGAEQHTRENECCTTHSRRSTSPRVARLNSSRKRARFVPRRIRGEATIRRKLRAWRHAYCLGTRGPTYRSSERTGHAGRHKWRWYVNDYYIAQTSRCIIDVSRDPDLIKWVVIWGIFIFKLVLFDLCKIHLSCEDLAFSSARIKGIKGKKFLLTRLNSMFLRPIDERFFFYLKSLFAKWSIFGSFYYSTTRWIKIALCNRLLL